MIKFYRTKDCPQCSQIQETLKDLVIAHDVVVVENKEEVSEDLPANARLPLLIDDGEIYKGSDDILQHLEDLEGFKAEWDKFQSDACYCDDEGGVE